MLTIFETKDYTKFYTPDAIVDQLVELAEIEEGHSFLEPSCGNGQIMKGIKRKVPTAIIDYYEIQQSVGLNVFLKANNTVYRGADFLDGITPKFDRIIANPPFEEDAWFSHLEKMYKSLVINGVLVSIIPSTCITTGEEATRIKVVFPKIIAATKAELYNLENWATNKDGTKTPLKIIKIRKM